MNYSKRVSALVKTFIVNNMVCASLEVQALVKARRAASMLSVF